MSSASVMPSTEGARARETPTSPRGVAGRLTSGVVLLVVGLLVLAAAVHESLYFAAWGGAEGAPQRCFADGSCEPAVSNAVAYGWCAVLTIAVATWLIAAAVHTLARRSDAVAGAIGDDEPANTVR